MKIYGCKLSRSLRVVWACEEAGIAYKYIHVDLASGAGQKKEYKENIHPFGKVPAMDDNGFVLTESSAICTYIGHQVPDKKLVPTSNPQKWGRYNQWMSFLTTELEQALWLKGKHTFALAEEWRVPEVLPTAEFEFYRSLKIMAEGLGEKDFLLGDSFSMVDVVAGQTLFWAARERYSIKEYPNMVAYMERLTQRPALEKAIQKATL